MQVFHYYLDYHFHDRSRWKPHWVSLKYNFGPKYERYYDGVVPVWDVTEHFEMWQFYLRHEMVNMFGAQGIGMNYRWDRRPRSELVFTFRDHADAILFVLMFKGKTTYDLFPLYVDYCS